MLSPLLHSAGMLKNITLKLFYVLAPHLRLDLGFGGYDINFNLLLLFAED
jgi:hypothetical protein